MNTNSTNSTQLQLPGIPPMFPIYESPLVFPENPNNCTLDHIQQFAEALLETMTFISSDRVNLLNWQTHQDGSCVTDSIEPEPSAYPDADAIHSCGAAACLGGWAALTPKIQAMGVYPHCESGAPFLSAGESFTSLGYYLNKVGENLSIYDLTTLFSINQTDDISDQQVAIDRLQHILKRVAYLKAKST